jgi:hypothetical protein
MVKLRAFVAGRGDARRVTSSVSEIFTEWKQPLPVVTVIQVGALPLEGAQVLIEAIAEERKPVNLNGLAFDAAVETAQPPSESGEVAPVAPLLEKTLAQMNGDFIQVACFVSSLADAARLDAALAAKFPQAARKSVCVSQQARAWP